MILLICQSGSFHLGGSSLGQAGGCRGLWHFCFPLQLGFCQFHGVLWAHAVPASLMCHLHWGLHCPSLPGQLCCLPCSGLVPRSFWNWGCWSKHPIPVACGSSSMLNCTALLCMFSPGPGPWFLGLVCQCLVLSCRQWVRGAVGARPRRGCGSLWGSLGKSCQG